MAFLSATRKAWMASPMCRTINTYGARLMAYPTTVVTFVQPYITHIHVSYLGGWLHEATAVLIDDSRRWWVWLRLTYIGWSSVRRLHRADAGEGAWGGYLNLCTWPWRDDLGVVWVTLWRALEARHWEEVCAGGWHWLNWERMWESMDMCEY